MPRIDKLSCHAVLVPASIFCYFFTTSILLPGNIDWLLHGDLGQHFIGWHAFRYDTWQWPISWTKLLFAPEGISIAVTDSNPLASILLKPFSPLLPEAMQFIGIWLLISVFLTYLIAHSILRRLCSGSAGTVEWRDRIFVITGAALVTLAPYLFHRYGHDTLTSQWIVLAAIWVFLFGNGTRRTRSFAALIGTSMLVHPYFVPMVLIFALMAAVREIWESRKGIDGRLVWRALVAPGLIYAAVCVTASVIIGLWRLRGIGDPVGIYTMDPLAWFNSMGYSSLLPGWNVGVGQYEGFQYLGLGIIGASAVATIATAARRVSTPSPLAEALPWLALIVVALFIMALSPIVTLFGKQVLDMGIQDLPVVGKLLAVFRSSGRLFWPASYLVAIFAVATLLSVRRPWARVVILSCLGLQIVDLLPLAAGIRHGTSADSGTPALDSARDWDALLSRKSEIVFMPADFPINNLPLFYKIMARAIPRGVSSNVMYTAQGIDVRGAIYPEDRLETMLPANGGLASNQLVVVSEHVADRFVCSPSAPFGRLTFYSLDGVLVATIGNDGSHALVKWACPPKDGN